MTTADQMILLAAAYEDRTYPEDEIRATVDAWVAAAAMLNATIDRAVHALDHLREDAPGTIDHGMIYRYNTDAERALDELLGQLSGPIYEAAWLASFSGPSHNMKYGATLPLKRWRGETKRMIRATKMLHTATEAVDA